MRPIVSDAIACAAVRREVQREVYGRHKSEIEAAGGNVAGTLKRTLEREIDREMRKRCPSSRWRGHVAIIH